jgi:hypothetical protein
MELIRCNSGVQVFSKNVVMKENVELKGIIRKGIE